LVGSLLETVGVDKEELAPFLHLLSMFPRYRQLVQSGCHFQGWNSVKLTGGFNGFSRNQQIWQ